MILVIGAEEDSSRPLLFDPQNDQMSWFAKRDHDILVLSGTAVKF